MKASEFLDLAISAWPTLLALSCFFAAILWITIRRTLIAGIFDPLVQVVVVAYGINYAVVALLFINGFISLFLFAMVISYGLIMLAAFRWASAWRRPPFIFCFMKRVGPKHLGDLVFLATLLIYGILSLFIIKSIGFGVFAATNRFEAARGYGSFIRIMDCLCPFIVSYATLKITESRKLRVPKLALLSVFVLCAAMINGAKISVLFSLLTALLTLALSSFQLRLARWKVLLFLGAGLAFAAFALNINLMNNGIEDDGSAPLSGSNLVVQRLIYRVIAFGDASFMTLPDNVIDRLQTDSIAVRFAAPLIGTGNISRLLGYEVGDYSVGRQALLYHDPEYEIAGGPTSHFDLFAYVYFGSVGGIGFVAVLGYLLGRINRAMHLTRQQSLLGRNKFLIALIATLWSRAVLVLIDPTVALAYIADVLLVFTLLSMFATSLLGRRAWTARLSVDANGGRTKR